MPYGIDIEYAANRSSFSTALISCLAKPSSATGTLPAAKIAMASKQLLDQKDACDTFGANSPFSTADGRR
ncbi:UNVERIFIED_ORG: hypothetical protein GGE44_000968 [Rhizobium esperanzae]